MKQTKVRVNKVKLPTLEIIMLDKVNKTMERCALLGALRLRPLLVHPGIDLESLTPMLEPSSPASTGPASARCKVYSRVLFLIRPESIICKCFSVSLGVPGSTLDPGNLSATHSTRQAVIVLIPVDWLSGRETAPGIRRSQSLAC